MRLPLSVLCFGIYHKAKAIQSLFLSIPALSMKKDSSPLRTLINKTIITKHIRPALDHLKCLWGAKGKG